MNYTTNFVGTENPLSEGGQWRNGLAVGLDWLDVQKGNGPPQMAYSAANQVFSGDECLACLIGTWTQNQTVQGTIVVNDIANSATAQLFINAVLVAHSLTGYGIHINPGGGVDLVRYDGAKGTSTVLLSGVSILDNGGVGPVATGSKFKITNVAGVLSIYEDIGGGFTALTGGSTTDNTYTAGAPGVGNFIGVSPKPLTDAGWSAFSALDDAGGGGGGGGDDLMGQMVGM